ncbi:MAG: ion transporter [Bosea sp. (in: a-proteobacteria)]|nr:MAG: ion transporter [Bosea sp. (in: a-proteobacteria)]
MTSRPLQKPRLTLARLRRRLHLMYHGDTPLARRFQAGFIAVDLAVIAFFLASPLLSDHPWFLAIDYSVAVLVGFDMIARGFAARDLKRWLLRPDVWVDLVILIALLAPMWIVNLAFLRVLRLWTLFRSPIVWRRLRAYGLDRWEEMIRAVVNLVTFLFVMTGFVYTAFAYRVPGIEGYLDALYFTVATVTTTGFGDITLPGPWGRIASVIAMIVGISLFVRLAQAVFRPRKVTYRCPRCALMRHEPDAVHCKACGQVLQIPNVED